MRMKTVFYASSSQRSSSSVFFFYFSLFPKTMNAPSHAYDSYDTNTHTRTFNMLHFIYSTYIFVKQSRWPFMLYTHGIWDTVVWNYWTCKCIKHTVNGIVSCVISVEIKVRASYNARTHTHIASSILIFLKEIPPIYMCVRFFFILISIAFHITFHFSHCSNFNNFSMFWFFSSKMLHQNNNNNN